MYLFGFDAYDEKKGPSSEELLMGSLEIYLAENEMTLPEDPVISRSDAGKPYFENVDVDFSISHTGRIWMCAMGKGNVGLDVQIVKYIEYLSVADRYFLPEEVRYIRERYAVRHAAEHGCCSDEEGHIHTHINEKAGREAFFDIWTIKEALAKYNGTSIFREMKRTQTVRDDEMIDGTDGICITRIPISDDVRCALAFDSSRREESIRVVMIN
jgi:4'-phosphopantetheinyl transferase